MLGNVLGFLALLFVVVGQLHREQTTMAAIDDLKDAIGAVSDDVRRIADDVKTVLEKLAAPDADIKAATELLKTIDADLDHAAETMEAVITPPAPPTPVQ